MKNINKIFIKIILAVLFIGVFLTTFFYILSGIQSKGDNTVSISEQIKAETERRNKISALNSEVAAIAPERALLETHFIQSSDVVPFLDTLQALAKSAGAPAEVSSLDLTKDGLGLIVQMKAEGNFESVHKLLDLLQNSPYELDFSSVKLERVSPPDSKTKFTKVPIWDASFKLPLISFSS